MPYSLRSALTAGLLLAMTASTTVAGTCSREDIDHYLDRGFTPDQIVDLCGNLKDAGATGAQAPATQASAAPVVTTPAPAVPGEAAAVSGLSPDDLFSIKHSLDADDVQITDADLIYTRDRCLKFGEEDAIGQRPTACVVTRTTISRSGLQVVRAVKGILLLQDREFIIKADRIKREVLNPEAVSIKSEREQFLKEFSPNPEQIDLPLRRGYEPPELAPVVQKLAR